MKLTDLTDNLSQEIKSLETQYKTVLQETTSLLAQQKMLTFEVEKKDLVLEETCQKIREQQELLKTLDQKRQSSLEKFEQQKSKQRSDLEDEALIARLDRERVQKEFEKELTEKENSVKTREQKSREEEVGIFREKEDNIRVSREVEAAKTSFYQEKDRLEQEKEEFKSYKMKVDTEYSVLSASLASRENDITKRLGNLVDREKTLADKEDLISLTLNKLEKQTKKLQDTMDSYERRIASFAEKEKLLEVRSIKLSDREAVASTH